MLQEGQNRWGSGKIRITGVELCDGAGTPRRIFVTGGGLEVRLHYRAEGRVEDPVFGLAIHHQNGSHIAGPNTDFGGLRIPFVEGDGEVVYRIPELTLLEGAYLAFRGGRGQSSIQKYTTIMIAPIRSVCQPAPHASDTAWLR